MVSRNAAYDGKGRGTRTLDRRWPAIKTGAGLQPAKTKKQQHHIKNANKTLNNKHQISKNKQREANSKKQNPNTNVSTNAMLLNFNLCIDLNSTHCTTKKVPLKWYFIQSTNLQNLLISTKT
jgi:hypothetical protein